MRKLEAVAVALLLEKIAHLLHALLLVGQYVVPMHCSVVQQVAVAVAVVARLLLEVAVEEELVLKREEAAAEAEELVPTTGETVGEQVVLALMMGELVRGELARRVVEEGEAALLLLS